MRVFHSSIGLAACAFVVAGCGPTDETGAPPSDTEDAASARDAGGPTRDAVGPEPARDATTPEPPHDAGPSRAPDLGPCWEGRWCWVEGAPVQTLDGASADTVYASDDGGRLWHWDGAGWEAVEGLESRRVRRVYVASADDLWVIAEHVGEAGFFVDRFDGTRWSTARRDVDPRYLEGFGSDNVWVRDRETLAWRRFDGRAWHAVEMPDPERLEVVYDGLYQKLMPGPAPVAYAIAVTRIDPTAPPPVTRETVVMRFDGATWERVGVLEGSGWAALAWEENEPRVVQYFDEGSAELRFDGERWSRMRWVPSGAESEGWLAGNDRGVALVPPGRSCLDVLPIGDGLFCTTLANGGVHGRIVSRTDARDGWLDTELPIASSPMSNELWDDVAPGYWARGSRRTWGDGPGNVLRVRAEDGILERIDARTTTPVLDEEGQPLAPTQIDGVTREPAWVAARSIYRVSGVRAERVPMPAELEWVQVHAIAAEPGGRAWALAGDYARALVLRIEGDVVWVDYEIPLEDVDFTERVELRDLTVDAAGDVWVLGSVGARSGHGILLHRGPGVRCGPVWQTIRLWDEAFGANQITYFRDALYVSGVFGAWSSAAGGWIGGSSVVRLPLESLAVEAVVAPPSDFALGRAPEVLADGQIFVTDGDFAFDWADPELWVGEAGVWLTTPDAARLFVAPR